MSPTKRKIASFTSRAFDLPTALFLLAALIFLYRRLFVFLFLPTAGNVIGDCFRFLASGQRLYQGEMIYRDFFDFVPPGTAIVNFLLFKLFGLRLWIPDLSALLLALGLVCTGVAISKKLMRPSLALMPSAVFLVGLSSFLQDPTHHWYSLLAASAAIAVLIEKRTTLRIAAAGLLCGISASFNQTSGLAAVVGFAFYLLWESRQRNESWNRLLRNQAWLLLSFLATVLAVSAYFICEAGPVRLFWCTVFFVVKYFPKQADLDTLSLVLRNDLRIYFPVFDPMHFSFYRLFARVLLLFAIIPSSFIFFFAHYLRASRKKPFEYWERPMLVAIVGLALFLSVAPAPDDVRMAGISLPALILLGWLMDSSRKLVRAFLSVVAVGLALVAFHAVVAKGPTPAGILTTPEGELAFSDRGAFEVYAWVQQHTQPSEYFYSPESPDEYFYLNLRNPTPLTFITNNGFTTTEQVAEVIRGLQQHRVRYILWDPQGLDVLPAWENPSDDHLGPLRDYIHSSYMRTKVFDGSTEVWERQTGS
jgi:hypothetical protein